MPISCGRRWWVRRGSRLRKTAAAHVRACTAGAAASNSSSLQKHPAQPPLLVLLRSQDEDNLREALRYSAAMLGELRTSFLSPQRYYELYMQAFDELGNLEVRTPLF